MVFIPLYRVIQMSKMYSHFAFSVKIEAYLPDGQVIWKVNVYPCDVTTKRQISQKIRKQSFTLPNNNAREKRVGGNMIYVKLAKARR
jgi:hypothetical protein